MATAKKLPSGNRRKAMKTAACYIRVSTDDQLEYSPDSQLEKIRDFAKRSDMILPEEFVFIEDEGVSGRKASKRREFQHMISLAKSKPKPFDVILVWKFSRFARNREDSIVYKSMLRKQLGIEVVSVSENIGDDKMSVITEAIIEAMDEYYSINLAEEVKRGMTEKARRGEYCSIAPFGYRLENKRLVVFPEQADIIREVFIRYVNGWGHKQLAVWLNEMGVTTNRGGRIENRTVEYWLNNPVYHGYTRWTPTGKTFRDYHNPDSIIVKGSHEAIINEELWNQTQKRLEEQKRKHIRSRRESAPTAYTLSGIIKCSHCGASLARSQREYLQCINYCKGSCGVSHHIKIEKMEMMLYSAIRTDLESGNFTLERAETPRTRSNTADYIKLMEKAKQKLQRISDAYQRGIDTIDEYKENKERVLAEIAALEEKIKDAPAEITAEERRVFAEKHLKTLDTLSSSKVPEYEKNRLLKEFIKSATFHKTDNSVSVIYLF